MIFQFLGFIIFLVSISVHAGEVDFNFFENQLRPFSSDGCSSFPDKLGDVSWQHCCVKHDVAYWKGGTEAEKIKSDEELKACVIEAAHKSLGALMEFGVRGGGKAELPTSWRWGYGWIINRGYEALGTEELEQVEQLKPLDLKNIKITKQDPIPLRQTVTGDYCTDQALFQITQQEKLSGLSYRIIQSVSQDSAEGTLHRMEILTDQCTQAYQVHFLLLKSDACTAPTNELFVRQRVRLQELKGGCFEVEN